MQNTPTPFCVPQPTQSKAQSGADGKAAGEPSAWLTRRSVAHPHSEAFRIPDAAGTVGRQTGQDRTVPSAPSHSGRLTFPTCSLSFHPRNIRACRLQLTFAWKISISLEPPNEALFPSTPSAHTHTSPCHGNWFLFGCWGREGSRDTQELSQAL